MKMRVISRGQDKKPVVNNIQKSPQAIAAANQLIQDHGVRKVLILAKRSLKTQWDDEVYKKFLNESCMVIGGTPAARKKQYDKFQKAPQEAMVLSYHTLLNDYSLLDKIHFDLVICDEAHLFKNRKGKINAAVKHTLKNIKYKIGLTGTPLAKEPEDAFGIMQCFDVNFFGSFAKFEADFLVKEVTKFGLETIGFKNIDFYRSKLQSIMIRRTELEVDVELPEVIPVVMNCTKDATQVGIEIELQREASSLSDSLFALQSKAQKTPDDLQRITMYETKLKGLIASRQALANDPRLFAMSKSPMIAAKYGPMVPANYKSDKTLKIIETVENITDSGHKVIVFSKFERQARLIADDLRNALRLNVAMYTGEENDAQRELNITSFKQDPDWPVLVATDAANEGLNLQMAKYIIHMDLPDLPAIKTQRNGRIRRVSSQFKHVYSYEFITENSYDVNRAENLVKLSNTIDAFVSLDVAQSEALREAMK